MLRSPILTKQKVGGVADGGWETREREEVEDCGDVPVSVC